MDRVLTLHFIDGSKLAFEFPEQAASTTARRLKMSDLLTGEREAILEHDGQEYRLRITANGKLILTK